MPSNQVNAYISKMARSFLVIILIMSFIVIPPRKAEAIAPALPVLGATAVFATCAGLLGYLPIVSNQSEWNSVIANAYDDFIDTTRAENAQAAIAFEAFVNNCVATQKISAQGFLTISQTLLKYFADAAVPDITSTLPSITDVYFDFADYGINHQVVMSDTFPDDLTSIWSNGLVLSNGQLSYPTYSSLTPMIIMSGVSLTGQPMYICWGTNDAYNSVTAINMRTIYGSTIYYPYLSALAVGNGLLSTAWEYSYTRDGYRSASDVSISSSSWSVISETTTSEEQNIRASVLDMTAGVTLTINPNILATISTASGLLTWNGNDWLSPDTNTPIDPTLPTDSDYGRLEALPDEIKDFTQDSTIIGKDVLVGNGSLADVGSLDILNPTDEELNRGLTYPDVLDGTGAIPTTTDGVSGATVANPSLAQTISIPGVGEMTLADAITLGYVTSISYAGDLTMPTNPGQTNFSFIEKFPFCIPFDLIAVLGVMVATPQAPSFTLSYPTDLSGGTEDYILDLEPFYPIAIGLKSLLILLFIVGLASKTRDLIRG